ncbi:MAG TPA: histidine kinase [Trebonia sp.]|nr:histidine kinase [Trebonia sp.]
MHGADGNVPAQRSGLQRIIPSWEYRHLRFWARVRIGAGIVLAGLGFLTLAFAANDWTIYACALAFVAAAAANLAFGNWELAIAYRQLAAPLPRRVRELERSRARVVDDSAARLRQIERDLHDGAQAQMVAVAMKLGLAAKKLGGMVDGTGRSDLDHVLELVVAAHNGAKEAIAELRDLARGIHPSVLDHGLGTALTTLVARSELPVELTIDLPERPSAAIESIAYFCAAELLANIIKHSGARQATLELTYAPGQLRLRACDDGRGGARIQDGGGLAGLAERIATVDGRLRVSSPPGGPTVVNVELPSHA